MIVWTFVSMYARTFLTIALSRRSGHRRAGRKSLVGWEGFLRRLGRRMG